MKVLICTDGSPAAEEGATLVARLGFTPDTEYTLLGVREMDKDRPNLASSMDRMTHTLGGVTPGVRHIIRHGHPADQILTEAQSCTYDLVVIGERGHQPNLPLMKLGSTAGKLARRIQAPLIVARKVPGKIGKVLFCTGGEQPSEETVRLGGGMLTGLVAEISLLHVMSQVFLKPDSPPDDLLDTAETAIARRTREGRLLQKAKKQLSDSGITSPITPRLRHGLVVEEILAEVREGKYDLLVLGAHHKPGQNRWLGLLLDDVADQLLNQAPCSVLIV